MLRFKYLVFSPLLATALIAACGGQPAEDRVDDSAAATGFPCSNPGCLDSSFGDNGVIAESSVNHWTTTAESVITHESRESITAVGSFALGAIVMARYGERNGSLHASLDAPNESRTYGDVTLASNADNGTRRALLFNQNGVQRLVKVAGAALLAGDDIVIGGTVKLEAGWVPYLVIVHYDGAIKKFWYGRSSECRDPYNACPDFSSLNLKGLDVSSHLITGVGDAIQASTGLSRVMVVRLTTDLETDAGFGPRIRVDNSGSTSWSYSARAVRVESDGRIIAGGFAYDRTTGEERLMIVAIPHAPNSTRYSYLPNGGGGQIKAMRLESDGKILVTSFVETLGMLVWRFTADTTPAWDRTFGTGGVGYADPSKSASPSSLAIGPDGRIWVLGSSSAGFHLSQISTSGAVTQRIYDIESASDELARAMTMQLDGKIVMAGGANGQFALQRVLTTGDFSGTHSTLSLTATATDCDVNPQTHLCY